MYKMSYSIAFVCVVFVSCMHGAAPAGYDANANYFLGFYLPTNLPEHQEVLDLVNESASAATRHNLAVKYKPRRGQLHTTITFIGKINQGNYDKLISDF